MMAELLSVLGSETTGIPGVVLWVSVSDGAGARLWVVLGNSLSLDRLKDAVVVRLTGRPEVTGMLPPEVAEAVTRFVGRNRDVLLRYWEAEISTREMVDGLEVPGDESR